MSSHPEALLIKSPMPAFLPVQLASVGVKREKMHLFLPRLQQADSGLRSPVSHIASYRAEGGRKKMWIWRRKKTEGAKGADRWVERMALSHFHTLKMVVVFFRWEKCRVLQRESTYVCSMAGNMRLFYGIRRRRYNDVSPGVRVSLNIWSAAQPFNPLCGGEWRGLQPPPPS